MSGMSGYDRIMTLGLIDMEVRRNAYGRQINSFAEDIRMRGYDVPFPAVFIRAPEIGNTGESVEVLAGCRGTPVLVRQGRHLAMTFHPELTEDSRIHGIFLEQAERTFHS